MLLASCGSTVGSMVTEAMDGCIAARNPVFTSGHGADALKTPLPANSEMLAKRFAYARGFKVLQKVAVGARDQVTLVCALDLMTHNPDPDVRLFVEPYLRHPSPDVASNTRQLLDRYAAMQKTASQPAAR